MTLEKIRDNPESFYNGPLANSISQDITEVIPDEPKKGQVTEQDLRDYQTEIREPLESELAGMKMHLTPPPTSGAVLGLILNILKGRKVLCSHYHHQHSQCVKSQRACLRAITTTITITTTTTTIIIIIIIIVIILFIIITNHQQQRLS